MTPVAGGVWPAGDGDGDARVLMALVRAAGFAGGPEGPLDAALAIRATEEQLGPLLAARVAEGTLAVADEATRRRLERLRAECVGRGLVAERALVPLMAVLRERSIAAVLLKGAALARTVYGAGERGMTDVDLLVPAKRWQDAVAAAESLGATRFVTWHRPFTSWPAYAVELRLPGSGTVVDLHRALAPWPLYAPRYDSLFARAVMQADRGSVPEAHDHFVALAVHAAKHTLDVSARCLVDGLVLAERAALDPAVVVTRATEWRARRATAAWIALLLRFGLAGAGWREAARALGGGAVVTADEGAVVTAGAGGLAALVAAAPFSRGDSPRRGSRFVRLTRLTDHPARAAAWLLSCAAAEVAHATVGRRGG